MWSILSWIVFGAFVGWLAGFFMGRPKEGCLVNIALGLAGSLVGGFLFEQLMGFHYQSHRLVISTIVAVIGAVIVLAIWNAVRRK